MIRPVPTIAAMAPYALADLAPGTVSLAQNEAFVPPSPAAIDAGARALRDGALYPDPDWTDLRAAIAEVHGVAADGILIGAGSMELIGALLRAFAGPGERVLGSAHGYLFVATACAQIGAVHDTVPEPGYRVDVDGLLAAARDGRGAPRIVFVCNPGNPTGTRVDISEIIRLRDGLAPETLLVVDQAYAEFDDQPAAPVLDLVGRGDTVVLRTFSKAYALAGARVGWGVFPPRIAAEVRKLLNPNNVPAVSQAMAAAAMRDQAYMRTQIVEPTCRYRADITSVLRRSGFAPPESVTNFVLLPYASAEIARAQCDRLLKAGYALRPMGGYGLPHCLRLTIAAPEHMNSVADLMTGGPDAD